MTLHDIWHSIKLKHMIKQVLTYFTILAITLVPVKLISANVENLKMQMSMQMHMVQQTEVKNDCMHSMEGHRMDAENVSVNQLCCDEQSDQCQTCNNCPQAANAMTAVFTFNYVNDKNYAVSTHFLKPSVSLLTFLPSSIYRPPKI